MRTNVLLLEDNPTLATAMAKALRDAGHNCRTANGVGKALREISRAVPHLLIADYHVVDGTAADLLAELGAHHCEHLPVVLATAAPTIARQTTKAFAQVKAILQKPVALDQVVAMVELLADHSIGPARAVRFIGAEERRRLLQFPGEDALAPADCPSPRAPA